MTELESQQPEGVSRRTVTKAMAWAVPVIAVAAPVPAFAAASQGIVTLDGTGCKLPGNSQSLYKGYAFAASANNTTNANVTITITSATLNGTSLGNVTVVNLDTCQNLGNPFTLNAGQNYPNLVILTSDGPNSQNGTLVVNYTVAGQGGSQQASTSTTGLDPIQGGCTAFTDAQKTCIASIGA